MGSETIISLAWQESTYVKEQPCFQADNLDYHAEISYKTQNATKKAQFELKLVRKFVRCLVETIFPTALLVLVCSVSLYKLNLGLNSFSSFYFNR